MPHAHEHAHPVTGPKTYGLVLLALLVLTVITVQASYFDFGPWNTVVALLIASAKGSLVALFFMHLGTTSSTRSSSSAGYCSWRSFSSGRCSTLPRASPCCRRT